MYSSPPSQEHNDKEVEMTSLEIQGDVTFDKRLSTRIEVVVFSKVLKVLDGMGGKVRGVYGCSWDGYGPLGLGAEP